MTGLEYQSLRELAAALASRQVSAAELTELSIARIGKYDRALNAVVVKTYDAAREEARKADAALARGESRPLLGVPMTVKEAFNVAGLPTTWGDPAQKDWIAKEDAVAVQRLRAAGAIILGKTNVPIHLADWQSYNDIYGATANPWDLSRSPGGSSGGSAAALAAGYVPLELGSDIGGSLRIPAHFCGVFAHKPTHGLVPLRGQTPPGLDPLPVSVDFAVAGPMARSAADLSLALDVIAGPDEPEAVAYSLKLPAPRHTSLQDFRVLVIDTHPAIPIDAATRKALLDLADRLAESGVKIQYASPLLPDLMVMARLYTQLLAAFFGADIPVEAFRRLQDKAASLPPEGATLDQSRLRGAVISHRDWVQADRRRVWLRARWRELFRHVDIVLCPVSPTPAFPHDYSPEPRKRTISIDGVEHPYLEQIQWSGIATLCGLPATAVPIGCSPEGLPIGVQLIGPYLEDRTPLALAELIEHEYGGFSPPPNFE